MSNSDHPSWGKEFQLQVLEWFQEHYNAEFELEKEIPIGNPTKNHKFDIADKAGTIAIECKRYTWTKTGNVPSGKIRSLNEAAFFLSFLDPSYEKYIVMLHAHHPRHKESLAEYYFEKYRHLLNKIIVAEYDLEKKDIIKVWQNDLNTDTCYLEIIRDYLNSQGLGYDTSLTEELEKRKAGKKYGIRDHIRAMVYSMLTSQTKWHRVKPHLPEIDKLFYDYDPERILAADPNHFCKGLFEMKCGNMNSKAQMQALADNIRILQRIEEEYGSIDAFITAEPANKIVRKLSSGSSPYKMKMLGEALAWEYLRNVGIDGAKPDTHMRRFLGADRMGTGESSPATVGEVIEQVNRLSEATGMSMIEIDNLIWSFCADGFGEVCTATPHCSSCPIRNHCNVPMP